MSNSSQAAKQTGSSVKEVYRLPRAGLFTSCTARWRASSKDCTYPPKISTISGTRRQTPRRTTTFLTQIYTRNAEVYIWVRLKTICIYPVQLSCIPVASRSKPICGMVNQELNSTNLSTLKFFFNDSTHCYELLPTHIDLLIGTNQTYAKCSSGKRIFFKVSIHRPSNRQEIDSEA